MSVEPSRAVGRVEQAVDYFERVGEPGCAIYNALRGTQEILHAAAEQPDLPALVAHLVPRATTAIFHAALILAEAVAGAISPEDVFSGLGFTNKLLTAGDHAFRMDLLSYTSIFSARLSIELNRRELQLRGFPLARAAQIDHAMTIPRVPETPVH